MPVVYNCGVVVVILAVYCVEGREEMMIDHRRQTPRTTRARSGAIVIDNLRVLFIGLVQSRSFMERAPPGF